ncbi:MAG: hypothetical protein ACKOFG_01300, partial [Limnohabitans sp.]
MSTLAVALTLVMGLAPLVSATPSEAPAQAPQARKSAKPAAKARAQPRREPRAATAGTAERYAIRSDAQQWADDAASRLDLPASWVRAQIGQA